jgi:hypothetical protein
VDAPLTVSDSESEDDTPGSKEGPGASTGTGRTVLNHLPKDMDKPCHRKQLKAHQKPSDKSEEENGTSSAMSDGESALRTVQDHERKKRRGPENHTLTHWNEPKATVDRKSKLWWLFKCRYCDQ